ncbi:MAG: glutathione S-transferase family protein [Geminicoccaceae bacterium]
MAEQPHLIVGNKKYSSWSMRPWLALRVAGLDFNETVLPLYGDDWPETKQRLLPSLTVPVLRFGETTVWDSLAIMETIAELAPDAGLWPRAPDARRLARSVSAEMHSSFQALRAECPMVLHERRSVTLSDACRNDIVRIQFVWCHCRERFGQDGPYLFGKDFTIADAMFAPVVTRFETYAIALEDDAAAYRDAVLGHVAVRQWYQDAAQEPWRIARYDR